MAALLELRDAGLPLPRCAFLMSPYADLTLSGETLLTKPFGPDTLAEAVHGALVPAAQGAVDNVVQLRTTPK